MKKGNALRCLVSDPQTYARLYKKRNSVFKGCLTYFVIFLICIIVECPVLTVYAITIDGDFTDWDEIAPMGSDKRNDISCNDVVDWVRFWMTHDETYIYISYETCIDIDFTNDAWRYNIFFDTDKNPFTGYFINGIGADYLFQGVTLFKYPYAGGGSGWPIWINLGINIYNVQNNRLESFFRRDQIGDSSAFDIVLHGDNFPLINGITDYFPDNIVFSNYFSYYLNPRGRLEGFDSTNSILYYHGEWPDSLISEIREKYDIVIVHPSLTDVIERITPEKVERLKRGADDILNTDDDVIVLGYINVGKDLRTYIEEDPNLSDPERFLAPCAGDGTGPKIEPWPGIPSPGGTGYASYYIDGCEDNDLDGNIDIDGLPDRHNGPCVVNASDPEWQNFIKTSKHIVNGSVDPNNISGTDELINYYGCDGLFLDDVSVPGPWDVWEWTARGRESIVRFLSDAYPDKKICVNRGLTFLTPYFSEKETKKYELLNIRPYINMLVFESFYCSSNFNDNRWGWAPKLNAEANRADGFTIAAIDWPLIQLDGMFHDWYADFYNQDTVLQEWVIPLDSGEGRAEEPNDVLDPNIDYLNIWATNDQNRLYIRFKCMGKIKYFPHSASHPNEYHYEIFIDIDQNVNTGYRGDNCNWAIGADFLVDNGCIFKYCGPVCSGWNWGCAIDDYPDWPCPTHPSINSCMHAVCFCPKYVDTNDTDDTNDKLDEIELGMERSVMEGEGFAEYRVIFRSWGDTNVAGIYDFAPNNPNMNYYAFVPGTFGFIERVKVDQGWMGYVSKGGNVYDDFVVDNNTPLDENAPVWDSTVASIKWGATKRPEPRVGIQEAEAGDGEVTVRWDVARDQTQPVKYNIYYSQSTPIDFVSADCLANVIPSVGREYKLVTKEGAHVYPYEYVIRGLTDGITYYFAVRAEDSTTGVAAPLSGRIGPGEGIEEINTIEKSAIPGSYSCMINIDGFFDDWSEIIPLFVDDEGDVPGWATIDFTHIWVTNCDGMLYIRYQTKRDINADSAFSDGMYRIYLDTNDDPHTGYWGSDGKWGHGAEFLIVSDTLYQYTGTGMDWSWESMQHLSYEFNGKTLEMGIVESCLGLSGAFKINLLIEGCNETINDYMRATASWISYPHEASIIIDGDFSDWDAIPLACADTIFDVDTNDRIDWKGLWLFRDYGILYLSYEITREIDFNYNPANFRIFIDKDNDPTTGYRTAVEWLFIGAEYLIEGGVLHKYYGNGTNWDFEPVRWEYPLEYSYKANRLEMAIPEESLSLNGDYPIRVLLVGGNNKTNDFLPNCQCGVPFPLDYETCRFSIDSNFADWTGIDPIGMDSFGDYQGNASDFETLWVYRDQNMLFLSVEISEDSIPFNSTSNFIFIDTDIDSNTGFRGSFGDFGMGADYRIIIGDGNQCNLYRYTGDGTDEHWELFRILLYDVPAYRVELAILDGDLGLSGDYNIEIMCTGDYRGTGINDIIDYMKDDKSGYPFPVQDGIVIDGWFDDWAEIELVGIDMNDIPSNADLDMKAVYVTNDEASLYLRLDVFGMINPALCSYIIYLDTDCDVHTGFTYGWWALGADYRIYISEWKKGLQEYMGTTQTDNLAWGWDGEIMGFGEAEIGYKVEKLECAVSRMDIGEIEEYEYIRILARISPYDDAIPFYAGIPIYYIYKGNPMFRLPVPNMVAIDDVGWESAADRYTELKDYNVLKYVGQRAGQRLQSLFIMGHFDPNNIMDDYPTVKCGEDITPQKNFEEKIKFVKEKAAYIEFGMHGNLHTACIDTNGDGENGCVCVESEFYQLDKRINQELKFNACPGSPWPSDQIDNHIECFERLISQFGIYFPKSFVAPSHAYYWNPNDANSTGSKLRDKGVKYANNMFRWIDGLHDDFTQDCNSSEIPYVKTFYIQEGGVLDHGVLLLHREGVIDCPYNEKACVPKVYPIWPSVVMETHWPNWLNADPNDNIENPGQGYVNWLTNINNHPERFLPKNTAQCYSQWLYRKYAKVTETIPGTVRIDNIWRKLEGAYNEKSDYDQRMKEAAYNNNLLSNLTIKRPLDGQHISGASIDGNNDNGAQIVAYYEDDFGYGYIILGHRDERMGRLKQDVYTLNYELGTTFMSSYVDIGQQTYNVFSFESDTDLLMSSLRLEMYGKQRVKIRLPFEPNHIISYNPDLELSEPVWEYNTMTLSMDIQGKDIQGEVGNILISGLPASSLIDCNISDWLFISPVSTSIDQNSIILKMISDTNYIYFCFYGNDLNTHYQLFIDSDNDPLTGFQDCNYWNNTGFDYLIEDSVFLKTLSSSCSWRWNPITWGILECRNESARKIRIDKTAFSFLNDTIGLGLKYLDGNWNVISSIPPLNDPILNLNIMIQEITERVKDFSSGLNLFGYPVEIPQGYTSYDLIQDLGTKDEVKTIQTYDPNLKQYKITFYDTNGYPDGNFNIIPGEGYLVYLSEKMSVTFHGSSIDTEISLNEGLNIVTIQKPPEGYSSYDLLLYMGSHNDISYIKRFNIEEGVFESTGYFFGRPSGDKFNIITGDAYLMYMKAPLQKIPPH